jgi:dihydroorotase
MTLDLIIKNATVMTAEENSKGDIRIIEAQTHVGVKDGKIYQLGNENTPALQIFDAKGLHLLPGVIDSQVHFREPGMIHKEDLGTGTKSAALGGVCSIFEMPNTVPATTTVELHQDKLRRADKKAWVNHAFFIGGSPDNVDKLSELEKLPFCPGIKIFMGSSTGTLLVDDPATLENIFRQGFRRIILHSEDEARLKERKHLALEGKDVRLHPVWRDVESALISTRRLLDLSEKTNRPVHVLHVTSADEMALLKKKKKKKFGLVTVEVLPQHLTLFAPECYERLGTLAQQNPPIREKSHQDALWKAIADGTVDVLGSDHAPHTLEEKRQTYPQSPSGMPGVQTLLPIMLNHVNEGKLSLTRLIELVCENPRHVFGCKSKGRIQVGLDADFTLVDLKKVRRIENKNMATRSEWTPFDGMQVKGWPIATIIAGNFVMQDDQVLGTPRGKPVEFQF